MTIGFSADPSHEASALAQKAFAVRDYTLKPIRNKSMTQTSLSTITRINRDELVRLSEKGKANPGAVRTLKVKTVRAPSLFGAIAGLSLPVIDFVEQPF